MRALVNRRFGGPEVLEVQQFPDLDALPGRVRIRVTRAGLNFSDIAARMGLYPDAPEFPAVLGYEVSGTVDALGPKVTGFEVGDRVFALCHFGGQASQVVVPATHVRKTPATLTDDEAAALPVNFLTAYHMLFYVAPLRPGMRVLIHMAAGGVGQAVIQLCRTVPDVEIFGTASKAKHEWLKAQGVHHCLDSRTEDYAEKVLALTAGKGVHRVLDPLGGTDWSKGYRLLCPAGHLVCFGWANMIKGERRSLVRVASEFVRLPRFSPMNLMDNNRSVSGVNMGHLWGEQALVAEHFDRLMELAEARRVKPHVDRVFALEDAASAHAYVQSRQSIGKVLLALTGD